MLKYMFFAFLFLTGCQQGYPWWVDADGDGWRNHPSRPDLRTDCDDNDPNVARDCGEDEEDDSEVNDSDELENGDCPNGQEKWYPDVDGDNHTLSNFICHSSQPRGYARRSTSLDCDDADDEIYPGAPERCNGADDDCDGQVDEDAVDATVYFRDADLDDRGNPAVNVRACSQPSGYVANSDDCKDNDATTYRGAPEWCDSIDHDCNGIARDDHAEDAGTWYRDQDGDGYGKPWPETKACAQPVGFVANGDDCDDANRAIHPGADEICNGVDDDCDIRIDDADTNVVDRPTWYMDADHDSYGDENRSVRACIRPEFHVVNDDDCNDASAAANPAAREVCDGIDNDCDGQVDEAGATGAKTWYLDGDGDGFGAGTPVSSCAAPAFGRWVSDNSDCDDGRNDVHPDHPEVCEDNIDHDCDGSPNNGGLHNWYEDLDGDGYGAGDKVVSCIAPDDSFVRNNRDCDDSTENTYPGASELCDGEDNDCDGLIDEGVVGVYWYADRDGDGFGNAHDKLESCVPQLNRVRIASDCDDVRPEVNPLAPEICTDGRDNDCDGAIDGADRDCGGTSGNTGGGSTGEDDDDVPDTGAPLFDLSCTNQGTTSNPYVQLLVNGDLNLASGLTDSIRWFEVWEFNVSTGGSARVIRETYAGNGNNMSLSVSAAAFQLRVVTQSGASANVNLLRSDLLSNVCYVRVHVATNQYFVGVDR